MSEGSAFHKLEQMLNRYRENLLIGILIPILRLRKFANGVDNFHIRLHARRSPGYRRRVVALADYVTTIEPSYSFFPNSILFPAFTD